MCITKLNNMRIEKFMYVGKGLLQNTNIMRSLILLVILALMVASYWPTFLSLNSVWVKLDESYSHGYLIAFLVVFYLFQEVRTISEDRRFKWLGAIALIFFEVVWLMGDATQTILIAQISFPLILFSIICTVWGWGVARATLPLVAILFFSIPIWDVFTHTLRTATATIVQSIVDVIGIPAYFDGFKIEVPAGVIEIASSCAGLNYFVIGNAFAAIYAYQNYLHFRQFALCTLAASLIAIIANWVRVLILVLVGYYSDMQHSLMQDHANFGWLVFGVALVPMLIAFRWISSGVQSKVRSQNTINSIASCQDYARYFALAMLIPIVPLLRILISIEGDGAYTVNPSIKPNISMSQYVYSDWQHGYKGFDHEFAWNGIIEQEEVQVRVVTYEKQEQGRELISEYNALSSEHPVVDHGKIVLASGKSLKMAQIALPDSNLMVVWAYNIGGMSSTFGITAKLQQFISLFRGRQDASVIMLSIRCEEDCEKEKEDLVKHRYGAVLQTVFDGISIINRK